MTSKRKIRANQENAKKSTGPRTPQGKRTSSQNAYKHGIWAKQLTISDEERDDYEKLVGELSELLKPEGPILQYYFDEIVLCMWRLRMLVPIESRQLVLAPAQSKDIREPDPVHQASEQSVAEQAALLDGLRKQLEAETILDARMRNNLLRCFGEEFTAIVDRFYPTQRTYSRIIALGAEQKAITYGIPNLLKEAEKLKRDAGIAESEEHQEVAASGDDEISRRQANKAIDKDKKILLTFIDQQIELVRSRQLQSDVKLQQADSVLVRFDLQLRYRAALTRDLRNAIEAFIHYNRSLRPGK